jgi:hypothetical protein
VTRLNNPSVASIAVANTLLDFLSTTIL